MTRLESRPTIGGTYASLPEPGRPEGGPNTDRACPTGLVDAAGEVIPAERIRATHFLDPGNVDGPKIRSPCLHDERARMRRTVRNSTAELFRRVAEHGEDVPGQVVLDLAVSRYRLGHPGPGVAVPIVTPSVPDQNASAVFDSSDQINPLHGTTNSSTLRMPASSPLVRSR